MKKVLSMFAIMLLSIFTMQNSYAYDCGPSLVQEIQVQDTNVLIRFNNNWHRLGNISSASTSSKLAVALAAQASARKVVIRYATNICGVEDMNTESQMIRIYAS